MTPVYANYKLTIREDQSIFAASKEGESKAVRLELERNRIDLALQLIEREGASPKTVRLVGHKLYQALFPTTILLHYNRSLETSPEQRLRLQLIIEDESLAHLPWEFLFDGQRFLGLNPDTPLVRYLRVDQPLQSLLVDGTVRILFLLPSPINYPDLKPEWMAEEIRERFNVYQAHPYPSFEIDILPHATPTTLMRRLRSKEFHILHFLGYSEFDPLSQRPMLVMEEENHLARKLSSFDLSELLFREDRGRLEHSLRALRLVLLNELEIPGRLSRGVTPDIAVNLVQSGIPAVLASQFSLPVPVALEFATGFYQAIFEHQFPIELAATYGRLAIWDEIQTSGEQPENEKAASGEWGAPVLYMHAEEGQLYHPRIEKSERTEIGQVMENVYQNIETFEVMIRDRLTHLFLSRLEYITAISVIGLITYWVTSRSLDLLFHSGALVALGSIWLLRLLITRRVPYTLNALWRRRLLIPNQKGTLAEQYLQFISNFNDLLNHPYYAWGPRLLGLGVVAFTLPQLNFQPIPQVWRFPLQGLAWILILPTGYILGTLLWYMIATIFTVGQVSHRFDLDIRPTRPDNCGGLKPLGDLYFDNAWIVLLAGLFIAVWLVIFSITDAQLTIHRGSGPSFLLALTNISAGYLRWFSMYQVLLLVIGIVAVITFFAPMWNTHKIMQAKAEKFYRVADSIAAEISELERYVEVYGVTSGDESKDISRRLEFLESRYLSYSHPPRWPFDSQVWYRLFGSLFSIVLSIIISEILPVLVRSLS